jgi:hypothetical protein
VADERQAVAAADRGCGGCGSGRARDARAAHDLQVEARAHAAAGARRPREIDAAQERLVQAAVERHAGGELGDVQPARLVVVELGERRESVRRGARGDDVGARLRVRRRERGGVAVADPERPLPLAHGDPEADAADQLPGRAAQDLRRALGERERRDERQRELPVGVPTSVSSTTLAASVSRLPVSASSL